jgi:hypothetical protein
MPMSAVDIAELRAKVKEMYKAVAELPQHIPIRDCYWR